MKWSLKTATRRLERSFITRRSFIVALDEDENVYFVKQFRYPFKTALMEIPAGKLEYGEDHLECGRRELKEEIGATAEK